MFALSMFSWSKKSPELCVRHLDFMYYLHAYLYEMETLKGKNLIKYLQPNRKAEGRSESQILLHFI